MAQSVAVVVRLKLAAYRMAQSVAVVVRLKLAAFRMAQSVAVTLRLKLVAFEMAQSVAVALRFQLFAFRMVQSVAVALRLKLWAPMYSRLKSTLLGHFKGGEKSVRDGLAGCHLGSAHPPEPAERGGAGALIHEDDDFDEFIHLATMPHFAYSWNVKYIGSVPVSSTTSDHVAQRLEKFSPGQPQSVEMSVSLLGVRISCEEMVILSHSLRRICSVVGRPHHGQIAYIATEPAGRTYRRLCHVFQAQDVFQLEEIERVLDNAFQAAVLTRQNSLQKPPAVVKSTSSTMHEKRSSSSAILTKLLGKKGSQTVDDPSCKRKRRPVSAVFSSAIHRLSNSTTSMSAKRMTTIETTTKRLDERDEAALPARISSPVPEEPTPSATKEADEKKERNSLALVFDEKLNEWCYPVDESMKAQLEQCNYFVGLPSRDVLMRNLLSQPEGAFVVRYSESKRRCLALSLRVPPSHNPSGISHYLIIRNEHGYRFMKGAQKLFASVQMLVTHHSVLQEHLPVPLHFVQWHRNDWSTSASSLITEEKLTVKHRHSTALTKIDENRNFVFGSRRCEEFQTPKRRSRLYPHDFHHRRSRLFEIDA
ncbi:unnamed protein product [Caenorhabditis auriculariae]|uniref:SH2 domain-containing protein n=1 Tax=Caenorhabditis auriculariae TaxID=2777116 RepID=A0A8S1H4L7_9PELO|nr:unnamed protein product [Caenorhabditis auriculariae]